MRTSARGFGAAAFLIGAIGGALPEGGSAQEAGAGLPGFTLLADNPRPTLRLRENLEIDAEPGAIEVVAWSWPPEIAGGAGTYRFTPAPGVRVLGRLQGEFTAAPDQRPPVISVIVPDAALSGEMQAGVMRFECTTGCGAVEIPLIVLVSAQEAIALESSRQILGGGIGTRVRTEVTLRNLGNVEQRVALALELPPSWGGSFPRGGIHLLGPGEVRPVEVEVRIPGDAAAGDYAVTVTAASETELLSRITLSVRSSRGVNGRAEGPSTALSINSAVARGTTGETASAMNLRLRGFLLPGVDVNGYLALRSVGTGGSSLNRSLGRHGLGGGTAHLTLSTLGWKGEIGKLNATGAGIIGGGIWGEGAAISTDRATWRFEARGIRSPATATRTGGHQYTTKGGVRLGDLWLGGLLLDSQLPGTNGSGARLAALDLQLPVPYGELALQGGYRTHEIASGMAISGTLDLTGERWSFSSSGTSLPGGRAAEARTERTLSLSGGANLTSNLLLQGGGWTSSDGGEAGFRMQGWNLGPHIDLGSRGSVRLSGTSTLSEMATSLGDFRNQDRLFTLAWQGAVGGASVRAGASFGEVTRTSDLEGLGDFVDEASTYSLTAGGSANSPYGIFEVDLAHHVTGAGVGRPQQRSSLQLIADAIPILPGVLAGFGELEVHRLGTSGSFLTSQVIGVEAWLPGGYTLTLDAEKDAIAGSEARRLGWVLTTSLKKTVGLPGFGRSGRRGQVFADLNGNGVRDEGEEGIPGVLVRAEGRLISTDGSGRFEVDARTEFVDIDPRSLPAGWMAARRPPPGRGGTIDLPVRPVAGLEIAIELRDLIGVDPEDIALERIAVVLRDEEGRVWTAYPDREGVLRFEAIPPGKYEISADMNGYIGVLVLPEELPTVLVEGGAPTRRVVLPLSSRPLRLIPQAEPTTQINRQVRIAPAAPAGPDAEGTNAF